MKINSILFLSMTLCNAINAMKTGKKLYHVTRLRSCTRQYSFAAGYLCGYFVGNALNDNSSGKDDMHQYTKNIQDNMEQIQANTTCTKDNSHEIIKLLRANEVLLQDNQRLFKINEDLFYESLKVIPSKKDL